MIDIKNITRKGMYQGEKVLSAYLYPCGGLKFETKKLGFVVFNKDGVNLTKLYAEGKKVLSAYLNPCGAFEFETKERGFVEVKYKQGD